MAPCINVHQIATTAYYRPPFSESNGGRAPPSGTRAGEPPMRRMTTAALRARAAARAARCSARARTSSAAVDEVDEAYAARMNSESAPMGDTQKLYRRDGSRTNS